jgi:hypothetical protein
MREAREEVCEDAEVVHSLRIVVLCAMQELRNFVSAFSTQARRKEVVLEQRRALC